MIPRALLWTVTEVNVILSSTATEESKVSFHFSYHVAFDQRSDL